MRPCWLLLVALLLPYASADGAEYAASLAGAAISSEANLGAPWVTIPTVGVGHDALSMESPLFFAAALVGEECIYIDPENEIVNFRCGPLVHAAPF